MRRRGSLGSGRAVGRRRREAGKTTVVGTQEASGFGIAGIGTEIGHSGQSETARRAAIIVALAGNCMMIAVFFILVLGVFGALLYLTS